jgi:anti-sigma B factor antagonist
MRAELSVIASDHPPIVIRCYGELDLSTASVFTEGVRAASIDHPSLTVDLSGVSFMDSRGMLAVIDAQRRLRDRDGDLVLGDVSAKVRRVLVVTQVWDLFAHAAGPSIEYNH